MIRTAGWYVNRYRANGEYVHVVGPDGIVFILTLETSQALGEALIAEASGRKESD